MVEAQQWTAGRLQELNSRELTLCDKRLDKAVMTVLQCEVVD